MVNFKTHNSRKNRIVKLLCANTFYKKNLHPYINPYTDNSQHLFSLYPDTSGFNTSRPGYMKLTIDGKRLDYEPQYKFFGTAKDFVFKSLQEFPELSHIFICIKNMIPESIYRVLEREFLKKGVKMLDRTKFDKNEINQKELDKAKLTQKQISQMQDGYHKLRGFPVASTKDRIIKIALYVARTPEDEKENPDEEWAIFPAKPTKAGEPDTIAKFKSRDDAVKAMKKMQKDEDFTKETTEDIEEEIVEDVKEEITEDVKEEVIKEIKEEFPILEEIEEATTASDLLQANVMHDWLIPEDAAESAWSLREESKTQEEEE